MLRNPHPFAVLVHARAERGVLHVELRGEAPAPEVHIAIADELIPFVDVVEPDPSLPVGERVVVSEGRDGHLVRRTRTIGDRVEVVTFRYRSQARLIRVGVESAPVVPVIDAATTVVAAS